MAVAAPHGYAGANALALAPAVTESPQAETAQSRPARDAANAHPLQPELFIAPTSKIIPFDQIQRHAGMKAAAAPAPVPDAPKQTSARPAPKRTPAPENAGQQTSLDFLPATAPRARTLKTEVEAVIFCDQPVATPMHRFVAAAIDAAMILFGFGFFVTLALLLGGSFGEGKMFWITMAACFTLISLFYGAIWAALGTETAGMRWTELQLITFDGFPVEGSARLLRFGATWLSFCSAGLGLLWSLVDEENLTWHDHISKTFPTVREIPRNFVRQRP